MVQVNIQHGGVGVLYYLCYVLILRKYQMCLVVSTWVGILFLTRSLYFWAQTFFFLKKFID